MDSTGSDDDGWDWVLSPRAVSSEWREPEDFLEPSTGSPFQKLRVGGHRLGCRVLHDQRVLRVESIRKREGAYSRDH